MQTRQKASADVQEAYEIGLAAYLYLYPLVTMDITRRQMTNLEAGKREGCGPMNSFIHIRSFPPADFKSVVRPNFDTLYSVAWLDLLREPVVVTVPDTHGRYYELEMLDMWSDAFAVPGKDTTGTEAGHFAVVPPDWKGELPSGITRIGAPTNYVWIIGRTQTNGPDDYAAVHEIQDSYTITPLSQWGRGEAQPVEVRIDPTVDMEKPPLDQVNAMSLGDYFAYAVKLMEAHPPHLTDWSILARMKRIGLEPGKSFEIKAQDPEIQRELSWVASDGLQLMREEAPRIARNANGWQMNTNTMGVYGNYYLKRAIVAMMGLGANPPEDAVYPLAFTDVDGNPINGDHNYLLHFGKPELPPVKAFWSLTMYDEAGFQVANSINRFAIGDRDALSYNVDGSLDIYIQHDYPGADKVSNWLPAPRGPLGLTMRLYSPKMSVLTGDWVPPGVKRIE